MSAVEGDGPAGRATGQARGDVSGANLDGYQNTADADDRQGGGKLYQRIREHKNGRKVTLDDMTVLATQNDPYRLDSPAGHRDGQWFLDRFRQAIGSRPSIHLRGLHYAIVARGGVIKPNGKIYLNTDEDWTWLQKGPAKAGRWLGYVPFNCIRDQRNDPPVIHRTDAVQPHAGIIPGGLLHIDIPDDVKIEPRVWAYDFKPRQPYHLVIFGEKSSLSEVVMPIAQRCDIDVYLPSGEITDTLLYQMARDGAGDGRPMRVFTLSDCDPAGHQMPVSISRKLQALRDLEFPDLDFEVRQIGLTVDQVRHLGLPSTPLKESEKRADRWRAAFGVDQTEIDALAQLRPDLLRKIIEDALRPFRDLTLQRRAFAAEDDWRREAQQLLDEQIDLDLIAEMKASALTRLEWIRDQVTALESEMRVEVPPGIELPPIVVPEPVVDENLHPKPLVSSRWNWLDQTAALKAHKAYGGEE